MNNINWDLAPEGAVELRELKSGVCLRWFNKQGEYFSGSGWEFSTSDYNVIAIRPTQTKTVADAVEWHKSKGWGLSWASKAKDCITHGKLGFAFADSRNIQLDRKLVCTRAEFEAYVKEQEEPHFKATRENLEKIAKDAKGDFVEVGEPEWTHIDAFGNPCRILIDELDSNGNVIIIRQDGWYSPVAASSLKPIKPKLTKAEAWDKMISMKSAGISYAFGQVEEKYDIVGVSAND